MDWKPDKGRPLCPQICEQLCLKIAVGEFGPNEKIMSVRDMAVSSGVNPNTVQRSFEMLEHEGILYSVPGSGWYVAEDVTLAKATIKRIIDQKTADYFAEMAALGINTEDTKKIIEEWNL